MEVGAGIMNLEAFTFIQYPLGWWLLCVRCPSKGEQYKDVLVFTSKEVVKTGK